MALLVGGARALLVVSHAESPQQVGCLEESAPLRVECQQELEGSWLQAAEGLVSLVV